MPSFAPADRSRYEETAREWTRKYGETFVQAQPSLGQSPSLSPVQPGSQPSWQRGGVSQIAAAAASDWSSSKSSMTSAHSHWLAPPFLTSRCRPPLQRWADPGGHSRSIALEPGAGSGVECSACPPRLSATTSTAASTTQHRIAWHQMASRSTHPSFSSQPARPITAPPTQLPLHSAATWRSSLSACGRWHCCTAPAPAPAPASLAR